MVIFSTSLSLLLWQFCQHHYCGGCDGDFFNVIVIAVMAVLSASLLSWRFCRRHCCRGCERRFVEQHTRLRSNSTALLCVEFRWWQREGRCTGNTAWVS